MNKSHDCVIVEGVRRPSRGKGSSATIGEIVAANKHKGLRADYRPSQIEADAQDTELLTGRRARR